MKFIDITTILSVVIGAAVYDKLVSPIVNK